MILRPRQKQFVDACERALAEKGNTVGVAATGFGKTICLGNLANRVRKRRKKEKILVLQHRDELVSQNARKFLPIVDGASVSIVDGKSKDIRGDIVFAMVQSCSTPQGLEILPKFGSVFIDECHHAPAQSYLDVLNHLRNLNSDLWLYGTTATASRGDRKGLNVAGFTNCADIVSIGELIASGNLVRPRTFEVDTGSFQALEGAKKKSGAYDDDKVASILGAEGILDEVVIKWKEHAGKRQTVVFCSNVQHSKDTAEAFQKAGVAADWVSGATGGMGRKHREDVLRRFDRGEIQVVTNVMVLTEGWDCQPVSCVILLRQSSFHSTYVQMIGRGLRTVDATIYPGVYKTDCIVLDFGTSTSTHRSLETEIGIDLPERIRGEALTKLCPDCEMEVPARAKSCPGCGYEWAVDVDGVTGQIIPLAPFELKEVDILNSSPFQYIDISRDGTSLFAQGFEAHVLVAWITDQATGEGFWYAAGGGKGKANQFLGIGDKPQALKIADEYLSNNEPNKNAGKKKTWLRQPPTSQQCQFMANKGIDPNGDGSMIGVTRYEAACLITMHFAKHQYRQVFTDAFMGMKEKMAA